MILTGESRSTQRKPSPTATFPLKYSALTVSYDYHSKYHSFSIKFTKILDIKVKKE
jgi:hypothetical protein